VETGVPLRCIALVACQDPAGEKDAGNGGGEFDGCAVDQGGAVALALGCALVA
jgi:hypothetical protein